MRPASLTQLIVGARLGQRGVARVYRKHSFPTQRVYGATPVATLRLITCAGPFNALTGHYRDNLVVFARRV